MAKKLTLSMNEAVIEAAKDYAQQQGVSLSSLIENLLKSTTGMTSPKPKKSSSQTPMTDGLIGIIKHVPFQEEDYKMHQGKKHGVI